MSDIQNPPLPDPGPGDGTHEDDNWDMAATIDPDSDDQPQAERIHETDQKEEK